MRKWQYLRLVMSCTPFFWMRKKFRKGGQKATTVEDEKGESEESRSVSPNSPPALTSQQPMITFTTCDQKEEEEPDDIGTSTSVKSNNKRSLRPRTYNSSVSSDRGYSSAHSLPSVSTLPSTSTLDVFRPRTLTGTSSNGSSTYHTPQGSVHNEPSPTNSGGDMPGFSESVSNPAAGVNLQMQILESINEKLDRLAECVVRLEASISRFGGEKAEKLGVLTVESMPDLTEPELPNSQCDNRVLLWLVRKVGDWKFLARWLGLQESDITQVEMDNPRSGREQCYQMLLKWKSVAPESYSYPVLGEALRQESLELFNAYVKEVHRVEG
jgi:hypothetical protein